MLSSGKLADANYQRIKYVTTSTTVTDAVACDDNANTEFHLLVKNGNSNKLIFKQFMLSSYYKIALLIIKSCMFFYGHILHFNLLHFLVPWPGSLSDVTIQCPDVLLGSFTLTFNETSCVNDTGALEVCDDNTLMTFNHTACSTKIAYSGNWK